LGKTGDQFVDEWQEATSLWDALQARQNDLRAQLLAPGLSDTERERLNELVADLSSQLAQVKDRMDGIIRTARKSREGRTGDFIVAEMGPELISDDVNPAEDAPVVPGRRQS
jgi:uncharacterized protein with von Willebrand factor type A (vWA) domain